MITLCNICSVNPVMFQGAACSNCLPAPAGAVHAVTDPKLALTYVIGQMADAIKLARRDEKRLNLLRLALTSVAGAGCSLPGEHNCKDLTEDPLQFCTPCFCGHALETDDSLCK